MATSIHDEPTVRISTRRDPSIPPPLPRTEEYPNSVVGLIYRELHRLSLRVGGARNDIAVDETSEGWTACGWVEGLDEDGVYQPYIWIASNARKTKEEAQGELLGRLLEVLA